jgi:zinc/manganese transport system permease protein
MTAVDALLGPFTSFGFMRRALVGCFALSLGAAPLGVFLIQRRMSLMGDAMAHAILPGAAVGYLVAGLSLFAMTVGGLVAGLAVALLAGLVARTTPLREDASFAAFYLVSLGLGVLLISLKGSNIDLLRVLFGSVLALDDAAILLVAGVATLTTLSLALGWRMLVGECFDRGFMASVGGRGGLAHIAFLALVVLNLVAGFQALGTLMVVGLMMLPAAAASFWAATLAGQIVVALLVGAAASATGLLASFHGHVAASPAIVLSAGLLYVASLIVGPHGGLLRRPAHVPRPAPLS